MKTFLNNCAHFSVHLLGHINKFEKHVCCMSNHCTVGEGDLIFVGLGGGGGGGGGGLVHEYLQM